MIDLIESSTELKELIRQGAIKDEKSVSFLGQKSDEFKRMARKAQSKADEKDNKAFAGRIRKLQGLDEKPMSAADLAKSEQELRERFAKLTGHAVASANSQTSNDSKDEKVLEERLKRLGPSQFPDIDTAAPKSQGGTQDDYTVQMALEYARKHGNGDETIAFAGADDQAQEQLNALLSQLSAGDDVDQAMLAQLSGGSNAEHTDDDAVKALILQAKDYARFGLDDRIDSDKAYIDHTSNSDSSLSSSSSDESDSESDSATSKKKKKETKKTKATRKSWRLF